MLNLILFIFIFILAVAVAVAVAVPVPVPVHSDPHRRFLHQPLYPVDSPPKKSSPAPAPAPAPLPVPAPAKKHHHHPKYPFTTSTSTPHFFPLYPSPPPPPPPPSPSTFPTFPANISSVLLPQSSSKPISRKLLALAVSLSLLSATLILGFLLYHRRNLHQHPKPSLTDGLRLVPPNTTPSDDRYKHPPPSSYSSNSSEFLYLGTLYNSRDVDHKDLLSASTSVSAQRRLGSSPELHPLPPLPRHNFRNSYRNHNDDDDDEDEFFSPRGSSGRHLEAEDFGNNMDFITTTSMRCSNSASPTVTDSSLQLESSSRSFNPRSTEMLPPPLPPPLPPARFWETGPAASLDKRENSDEGFENLKPKLKPLHWDKVKASSNRTMVWDHLKSSSSFQLNEEMIETLFMVNSTNMNAGKNHNPYFVMPSMNQENKGVLDHKKSQNISILLRAVNLTIDEICEALFEGNSDTMGIELLESLLKMAPTKEEEDKLKELKDEEESPLKIGPAEKFLKSLLEIPFAFKRIEAMLYIANFDSEFDYLQTSLQTLEAASEELRNNRMFMKLLEAVLRTGNRMNIGTNRGDAHAFKLDTLLKLVDIKGTDGKTTLLHFVVEEIVKSEGSRLYGTSTGENHPSTSFQEEKKLGLQVVSNLSTELKNVKKAASMEYDELINEVAKLGVGMGKVVEVLKLNEKLALKASSRKFSAAMKGFLEKAEKVIIKIQQQENRTLTKVKEITEYFHGNSSKEEAHPFRIFMIVRDFLTVLDRVCKEVGRITPPLTSTLPVFPVLNATRHNNDDDVE